MGWLTPEVRSWIYNVSMACIPLLITVGVLNEGLAKDVALVVSALLGFGSNMVARVNVVKPTAIAPEDARG